MMGVLNGIADFEEEVKAVINGELVLGAVVGDFLAVDEFHREIRAAAVGRSGVEDFGDIWMVHERERLAFGSETRDYLRGVHARFNDL